MAKKKSSGTSKNFTFSEIGNMLNDMSASIDIVIAEDEEFELIDTGIYILNAAMSGSLFGGVLSNRITTFAGPSGTGKSFLAYSVCRRAQEKGWNVVYIDTEFSIQKHDLPKYGIDVSPDKFILVRSNIVEDVRKMLSQLLDKYKTVKRSGKEIPKTLFVLDSVGMLASRKESNDAKDGKETVDMTRAKTLASLFRIINSDLGYLGLPLICCNHTYDSMDLFPKQIMKGGNGLYYSSSVVSMLSKAKLKTGEEDEYDIGQSGITVTFKTEKNRMAKPKKVKFDISFNSGSNRYKGLEMFCTPENFEDLGIAKGKWEDFPSPKEVVDEQTGEVKTVYGELKPTGHRYYVRHLGKSMFEKQIFNSKVFTDEILQKMEKYAAEYFKFNSLEEIDEHNKDYEESGEDENGAVDIDSFDASNLFD